MLVLGDDKLYFTNMIAKEYENLKIHEGNTHNYLGMEVHTTNTSYVEISMIRYIESLLEEFDVTGVAVTPAMGDIQQINYDSPLLNEEAKAKFHSAIMKVLFLAARARPDILYATTVLTTRVQEPREEDNMKFERILKYLNGTKDLTLRISADPENIKVDTYIDSAHGVTPNGRGQTGSVRMFKGGGGVVYANPTKQNTNTRSSCETELQGNTIEGARAVGAGIS